MRYAILHFARNDHRLVRDPQNMEFLPVGAEWKDSSGRITRKIKRSRNLRRFCSFCKEPEEGEPTFKIAFNVKTLQPGCVNIQAAMGTDYEYFNFDAIFPAELWSTSTDGMKVYSSTWAELKAVAKMAKEKYAKGGNM